MTATGRRTAQVHVQGAQRHLLRSESIGETFTIDVLAPSSVSDGPVPVIYLTDGDMMFPIVSGTLKLLQLGREVPEVVLVGIGYEDAGKAMKLRNRDLTPTVDTAFLKRAIEEGSPQPDDVAPGGADAFLEFISTEVKPLIESIYPAKRGEDTLMGDSLGGLFSLYAMLTRPDDYQRYVAGSPSLWWDEAMMFDLQARHADATNSLDTKLFISVGGMEESESGPDWANMVSNMHRFAELLAGSYVNLQMTKHEFQGETHLSVIPATFCRGLREVFGT